LQGMETSSAYETTARGVVDWIPWTVPAERAVAEAYRFGDDHRANAVRRALIMAVLASFYLLSSGTAALVTPQGIARLQCCCFFKRKGWLQQPKTKNELHEEYSSITTEY
jgi:hypothetical protein